VELRGSATKVRGRIAILASGTGTVIGTCELWGVEGPLKLKDLRSNARRLGERTSKITGPLYYRNTYARVLRHPKRLRTPVPYSHPQGAVMLGEPEPRGRPQERPLSLKLNLRSPGGMS